MRQAFVRASSVTEGDPERKKRRRVGEAGDGRAISSIYESIVQPGKNGGFRDDNRGADGWSAGSDRGCDGRLSPADDPTAISPSPPPAGEAKSLHRGVERAGARLPEPVVFGPAENPNPVRKPGDHRRSRQRREEEGGGERGFFCRVCGERVQSTSEEKHATSTLHIFNQKHTPQERKVHIDESNRGFQLLAGMGWRLDEGLGARSQGRVNPLQTTFKQDSAGLGAGEKLRPRVTHFPSHVPSQALNAPDGKSDAMRAQERLDHRRGRRGDVGAGKPRSFDGCGSGGGRNPISGGAGCERPGSASAASNSSDDCSWGGFWGQGSKPGGGGGGGGGRGGSGDGDRPSVGSSSSRTSGRRNGIESDGVFMSRKERKAHSEREKRKERRAKFELLSDVPEEYAALFVG